MVQRVTLFLRIGNLQVGPISGCISTHELHASHLQLMMPTTKLIKNYETYQNC